MMDLRERALFRQHAFIDGAWVDAGGQKTYAVHNPATGEKIGVVPAMGAAETRRAIEAADGAWAGWRAKPAKERAGILRKWFELMMSNQDDLARVMTIEQGKPLAESRGEIAYAASFVEWFAEEAKRIYGDVIPEPSPDRKLIVLKQPVGVVAAITPWNFPSAMITRKCAPALAAGCTVVVKPAEQTPYSALALAYLAELAGVPKGVFNVVTAEDPVPVGEELTANPKVRKVSFTGSTEVGKWLLARAAQTVKKVSMELGGNAPFIVFDDADLDAAVAGAMASKYRNSGQTCVCANRFLLQRGVYEKFASRFAQAVRSLKLGNGLEQGVTQGPLIDANALAKVERLVADAKDKGARAICGGARAELGGNFYQPTILADVTTDMAIANEEIFGPVAPLFRFHDEADAIRIANATPYGLASYVFSRDIGRVWRVADALEYGIVGINVGIISVESAPFGGMKESGIGREGSKYGMEEFLEVKYLCMGDINK
ncbi:MAG TPA: NAD-dependent succinate-semialdehyde dehydrogenase [Rhodospirillales bacterium]